jgi:uncharacterized RDD family membrane protein YckC
MKLRTVLLIPIGVAAIAAAAVAPAAAGQAARPPVERVSRVQPAPAPPVEATPEEIERRQDREREQLERERVEEEEYWRVHTAAGRFGQDYHLQAGEVVRHVVVVKGNATLAGTVLGDVQVIFGNVRLEPTAVIRGSLFVGGGMLMVASGARVNRDLVIAGGSIQAPPDFTPGHDHFVIAAAPLVNGVHGFLPWITEGLLLARPVVPRLRWVWMVLAIVFFVSLALTLLFTNAVRQSAAALRARPLSTFLTGLLVLLLTGPLAIVLAASVVGLAVVPFLFCAIAIAWLLGKVGVAIWLGGSTVGIHDPDTRTQAVTAFAIGFALITIAYMVPILGFIVYGLVGVFGLGAATLAFTSAYRRENPVVPKPTPTPPPPSPDVPSGFSGPAGGLDESPPVAAFDAAPAAAPGPAAAAGLVHFPRAGFLERLGAFALDCILVLIVVNSLGVFDDDGGPILALLAYHIAFWTWKATTLGGIICQLRVVRVNGEPLRFVDALIRGCTGVFSLAVAGLGGLWILRDPERQSWHDKVAGTYVVKVPRNWPI